MKMKFKVRMRRVEVKEFYIESESLKAALRTASACAKYLENEETVGVFYEIESITYGGKDDRKHAPKPQRTRRKIPGTG